MGVVSSTELEIASLFRFFFFFFKGLQRQLVPKHPSHRVTSTYTDESLGNSDSVAVTSPANGWD